MVTVLIILLIAIDQISKLLVLSRLASVGTVEVIPGFFNLQYLENRGAAFGILQEGRPLFIVMTTIVVALLLYAIYIKGDEMNKVMRASLILILAGAVGNFIDRLRLHFVVDFLSFNIFGHAFAVFNLADSMIVVGTILLVIQIIFKDEKKRS
ncbi:MAG: signal peptidase II [Peptoniphilus sp.]|nr:signal peptidase II [Peptoniphilus sp.]MDD7363748.1 signal peptidase II [Bacillota bacterium]MDY6044133.1 signal peptidase II [Peptoniphilus sp.]